MIWDRIGYLFSLVLIFCFVLGLVPYMYDDVFWVALVCVCSLLVVSFWRFRVVNILFEMVLFCLVLLSLFPVLGYVFRFLGIVVGLFELSTFKGFYQEIKVMKRWRGEELGMGNVGFGEHVRKDEKKDEKGKKSGKGKVVDADFEEK